MPPVIPKKQCIVPCHLQLVKPSRMRCHSLVLQREQLYYSPFPFIVNFSIPEFFSMVFVITRSNIQSLVVCSLPSETTLSVNLGLVSLHWFPLPPFSNTFPQMSLEEGQLHSNTFLPRHCPWIPCCWHSWTCSQYCNCIIPFHLNY